MLSPLGRATREDPPFGGRRPRGGAGAGRIGIHVLRALAALVAGLALLAGCGGGDDGSGTTAPAETEVTVWFSDDSGTLVAERRSAAGGSPLEAAMRALAEGPDDPALIPALPEGTTVLGAGTAYGVATVDLSAEFETGYPPGGAAAELAVIGPVVMTATEASGADSARVLVEGRVPEPAGAQFDLSQPIAPGDLPAP
ncbi:MAG: GerMN domain-containing protein [Thermoleophilia bacterium]